MNELLEVFRDETWGPWIRAGSILLASLVLAKLVDVLLCRSLLRLTRNTDTDMDNHIVEHLHRPIFVSVVLLGVLAAAKGGGMSTGFALVEQVVKTLLLLVWLFAGLKIAATVFGGLDRLAARVAWLDQRTIPLFDNLAKVLLFGLALYAVLSVWHLDVTPWLASAGIAGIALGFAAKDTLANLFGGLFVIIDAPYKVGDYINLDSGERGQVIKIGLRSTRLLTRDDIEVTLPNATIANSTIVNESGGPWEKTRVAINVGVAYGSDVDRVREVLLEAALSVEYVLRDPEPRLRFQEMGDSALIFRILCWVEEPVLRGRCIDGLNMAVYKALVRENISIPFPQRDVHLIPPPAPAPRNDTPGNAPE